MKREVDCSLLLPVYGNADTLVSVLTALQMEVVSQRPDLVFEIVLVDDGSEDNSYDVALRLREQNPELVRVLKLTRNFGQVNAWLAGLSASRGRCSVLMAADGQDPPELVLEMLKQHFDGGNEIVICARTARDESAYRRVTSRMFYSAMRRLCFKGMPVGGFDFMLLGQRVVEVIQRNREAHMFFQGQVLWTGYRVAIIPYHRRSRISGTSKWSFAKRLTYLLDGLMGYSFAPIRWISMAGLVIATLGFTYAAVVLLVKIFAGNPVEGWTPLMIAVLVTSGLQMVMLGVMGEYLWRVLAQVRNRDPYIIEDCHDVPGCGAVSHNRHETGEHVRAGDITQPTTVASCQDES
jgi:glycosyltransferase involved in cell wall biosynthesis